MKPLYFNSVVMSFCSRLLPKTAKQCIYLGIGRSSCKDMRQKNQRDIDRLCLSSQWAWRTVV